MEILMLIDPNRSEHSLKVYLKQICDKFSECSIEQVLKKGLEDSQPDIIVAPLMSHEHLNLWLDKVLSQFSINLIFYADPQNLGLLEYPWALRADVILVDPISEAQTIATLKLMQLSINNTKGQNSTDKLKSLSLREQEIVRLVRTGLSSKEIAHHLFLSMNTINTHKRRIKEKLGVRKFVEIA